jgi:hypothetical protein
LCCKTESLVAQAQIMTEVQIMWNLMSSNT